MSVVRLIGLLGRKTALGGSTTWNPSDKGAGVTLSGGNLTMSVAGATANMVRSTTSKSPSSGKFYAEITVNSDTDCRAGNASNVGSLTVALGDDIFGTGYANSGTVYSGGPFATYAAYGKFATIGIALDRPAGFGTFWFSRNGVYQSGNPAAGTGGIANGSSNPLFLAASAANGASVTLNCGQLPFYFDPPAGFSAWG